MCYNVFYWVNDALRVVIMNIILKSPQGIAKEVASRIREARLDKNWTQASLSERSGVSLSVLKKFEKEGKIAFLSLIKLSMVLRLHLDFEKLLFRDVTQKYKSVDELVEADCKQRQRGRL